MRYLLAIISFILVQNAFGQERTKIVDTKATSKGVRYNIVASEKSSINRRVYSNAANKLDKEKFVVPESAMSASASIDMREDEAKRRDIIIKNAFNEKGLSIPDDTIIAKYRISPKGKILEMDFFVSSQSKISIEDIALIEETLKDKYTVKMNAEKFKGMKFTVYAAPINLSRIKSL
jgi:hypothetical protein